MPFGSIEEGIASVLTQQREALSADVTPVYVPLLGKNFASEEADAFDLETSVRQFIAVENQRRVLVLYGDAGSGKSSFFQTLTLSLLAEYTPECPIPLFISLPTLRDPVHRAVEETLENYGFSAEQVEALKERHSFVFIFDGYDEIHQLQNLYMSNRLNIWQAKTLISCRSQYVHNKGNPDIYFMPLIGERQQPHLLATLYTAAFNETQIGAYLAVLCERGVAIPSYEEMQVIPGLKALVTTPFLLHMTVEALPDILARYSAASSSDENRRLKQTELYDAFITQWFLRQEAKLKTSGHITDDMLDKKPVFWRYAQALASEMHKHDVTWVSPLDERFAVFFDSDAETEMLRSACPLKKSGESFGFWHQSLGTYFTVRTMYEEECAHETELTAAEPAVMGAGVGAGSGTSVSSISVPPPIGGIHNRLITDDFSALKLLTDQVDAQFKKRLFAIIEASKVDERYAIGAANAITILNWMSVYLQDKAWSGIQIPGANLSYAQLMRSDLSKANLKGCRLFRANLQEVNLSLADLREAEFFEKVPIDAKDDVCAVAYHPTKPWIAVTVGKTIVQYHVDTGEQVGQVLEGHTREVTCVSYSPDGLTLAGSISNTIRQWTAATGEPFGPELEGHITEVTSVSYSPDGLTLASGSLDGTIRQWIAATGEPFGPVLEGHTFGVHSVSYSPDGLTLASGSGYILSGEDNTVRQWIAATGEPFGPVLEGHTSVVRSVSYSPDGLTLASGSLDGTIRQWIAATGEPYGLVHASSGINSVHYSPDGLTLASGSKDGIIRQWEAKTEALFGLVLQGHTSEVTGVSYSPDGLTLASGSRDGTIRQWEAKTGLPFGPVLDGSTLKVETVASLGPVRMSFRGMVTSVSYSSDGLTLASVDFGWTIHQWEAKTGLPFGPVLEGHTGVVTSVSYSPNGLTLASGSRDGTIRQWKVKTGEPCGPVLEEYTMKVKVGSSFSPVVLERHRSEVTSVSYSPDGQYLASGTEDEAIRQWVAATGEPFGPLLGRQIKIGKVTSVSYSPDGQYLVSGNGHGVIYQWEAKTGELFGPVLEGHKFGVTSVSYSPDGLTLVSGSVDNTIRQWIAATGEPFGPVLEGSDIVSSVSYSPDSLYLASSSARSVCLWHSGRNGLFGLIWKTRSAADSLMVNALCLASAYGLSPGQLALLRYFGCKTTEQVTTTAIPRPVSDDSEKTQVIPSSTISMVHPPLANAATISPGDQPNRSVDSAALQTKGLFGRRSSQGTSALTVPLLPSNNDHNDAVETEGCCSRCSVM